MSATLPGKAITLINGKLFRPQKPSPKASRVDNTTKIIWKVLIDIFNKPLPVQALHQWVKILKLRMILL